MRHVGALRDDVVTATSQMVHLGVFVILLRSSDSFEKLGVGDALVSGYLHRLVRQREFIAEVTVFLEKEIAAQELVQLVLVHDVALVPDRSRVRCLGDQLRHDANLLDAEIKLLILEFFELFDWLALFLLSFTGPGSISSLLLLDFG